MKINRTLKILVLSLWIAGSSCSPPQPTDIVAKVDGESITVRDLAQSLHREGDKFSQAAFENSDRFQEVKRRFLEDLIQKKLLVREAKNQGIDVSDEELEKEIRNYKSRYTEKDFQAILEKRKIDYAIWRETKKANLIIDRFLREKIFSTLTLPEEKIKSYYEEHSKEFLEPESVHIRQILTDTKEKADDILKRLKDGENFAKLAHDLSLSPDRAKGGDVGFIRRGAFPKEFEICFDLKVGELSSVVSSLYGFHIFKVLEKKPETKLTYEEAKPKIEEWLKQEVQTKAFETYYQELRKKYPVEINNSVLKRVVL